jgi:hypothetical protein
MGMHVKLWIRELRHRIYERRPPADPWPLFCFRHTHCRINWADLECKNTQLCDYILR